MNPIKWILFLTSKRWLNKSNRKLMLICEVYISAFFLSWRKLRDSIAPQSHIHRCDLTSQLAKFATLSMLATFPCLAYKHNAEWWSIFCKPTVVEFPSENNHLWTWREYLSICILGKKRHSLTNLKLKIHRKYKAIKKRKSIFVLFYLRSFEILGNIKCTNK